MFIEREILGRRVAGVLGATHCVFFCAFFRYGVGVGLDGALGILGGRRGRQRGRNLEIRGVGIAGGLFRVHA